MQRIIVLIIILLGISIQLFSQDRKVFKTEFDTINYHKIISDYFRKNPIYDHTDSAFRKSVKYLTSFTTHDSIVKTLEHTQRIIAGNMAAIEISKLYSFRNTVDSLNTVREKIMADYWTRQQLINQADTGVYSTEDTLFIHVIEALSYQDTINLDSIIQRLSPYNPQLLQAIDLTIHNFTSNKWVNWIRDIRNDTVNFYLVNIDGDSMLIRLYDRNPDLIKFDLTDYWGSKIPAAIRDINNNSFRLLIDDVQSINYDTEEKARLTMSNLDTLESELNLTLKPIHVNISKPRWLYGGNTNIDLSQIGMYQWAQGGDPTISVVAGLVLFMKYNKDNINWDNRARFRYGKIRQGRYQDSLSQFRSLEDKIELITKYGYRAFGQYYVSISGDFKSQFGSIYEWDGNVQGDKISDFMAPAYINFSLGLDYKPNKQTTLFLSPISSKFTYVLDPSSAIKSKYGVDTTQNSKKEFGIRFKGIHKMYVWDNIEIRNELELFSNYSHKPQCIDIDWEFNAIFPVNDYIRATFGLDLVYDDDTDVPKYKMENGVEVRDDGPGLQFRERITLGFSFMF